MAAPEVGAHDGRERIQGPFGGDAWSLGRIAGIPMGVDRSWLLIAALVTVSFHAQLRMLDAGASAFASVATACAMSVLFFGSVVLHELGHSLVARRRGVAVESITLFLFGGVARILADPKRPRDEVEIALAGPAVSFALGGGFLALAVGLGPEGLVGAAAGILGRINLVLAVFNLVPGLPLDGGRVLRGVLWARSGSFEQATRAAGAAGAGVAWLLILLGGLTALAGNWGGGLWLVFIGWFLLTAARASVSQVVVERALAEVRVRSLTEPADALVSPSGMSVQELVDARVLGRGERVFHVVDRAGVLLGLLTLREIAAVAADRRASVSVIDAMRPVTSLVLAAPEDSGWQALQAMVEADVAQLPVVEGGRLVGVVTRQRLLDRVHAAVALGARRARAHVAPGGA